MAEGLPRANMAAWLAAQERLSAGPGAGGPRPMEGDEALRLHAGDLVVVDESAMTDTAALAAIHLHVDAAGRSCCSSGTTSSSARWAPAAAWT